MPSSSDGRFGKALAALSAAPPSRTILIAHDWWKALDHYRAARWRRVRDVVEARGTPDLDIRHDGDCCSGPEGDRAFRHELAQVLNGPEPEALSRYADEGDKEEEEGL